jgi:uncharacterized membrane protein YhhN
VRRERVATLLLISYAVASVVDLIAELAGFDLAADLLPLVLMPLLAGYLISSAPRARMVVLVAAGLGFSWLGDTLGYDVLVKIGFFLGAQICYVVAFWPLRRRSIFGTRATFIGYVVGFGGLIVFVATHAGNVGPAVAVYGASLGMMIGLAPGVHRFTAIGALLFLVSDLALAWGFFFSHADGALHGFLVMATYLPAQFLITYGVVSRTRGSVMVPIAESVAGPG